MVAYDFYKIIYSHSEFEIIDVLAAAAFSLIPVLNFLFAVEPLVKHIQPAITKWLKSFNNEKV